MTARITRDHVVMFGKPVSVETYYAIIGYILRCLAAGDSLEDIVRYHPQFTLEDIRMALHHAADFMVDRASVDKMEAS